MLARPGNRAPVTERSFGRGKAIYLNADSVKYGRDRLQGKEQALHGLMERILNGSVGEPEFLSGHARASTIEVSAEN